MQTDPVLPRSGVPAIDWPALPGQPGDGVLALLFQLEQSQWWGPDVLRTQQLRQLRSLLEFARRQCPWYREDPTYAIDGPCDLEGLRSLPIIRREQLQRSGDAFISASLPAAHGRRLRFRSTGSTSRPLQVQGTDLSHLYANVLMLREDLWQRRDLTGKLATIRTTCEDGLQPDWGGAVASAFKTGPCATLNIRHNIAGQAEWLREQNPAILLSHPSNIEALARHCQAHGIEVPALSELRSFGEVLPPGIRALCREVWGARLTDSYSCEEVGAIALQCPQHDHYHVQAENLLVEVLDQDDRPCAPGQVGRVVITTLHNLAQPLIRYEIGDHAELGGPCDCGRGLPVMKRIMGRGRNMLRTPDGGSHWPSFPSGLWMAWPQIRQFRIVQESLERIVVELVASPELSEAEQRQLGVGLQQSLGHPFSIAFRYRESLDGGPGGKREDFISLLGDEGPA